MLLWLPCYMQYWREGLQYMSVYIVVVLYISRNCLCTRSHLCPCFQEILMHLRHVAYLLHGYVYGICLLCIGSRLRLLSNAESFPPANLFRGAYRYMADLLWLEACSSLIDSPALLSQLWPTSWRIFWRVTLIRYLLPLLSEACQ